MNIKFVVEIAVVGLHRIFDLHCKSQNTLDLIILDILCSLPHLLFNFSTPSVH